MPKRPREPVETETQEEDDLRSRTDRRLEQKQAEEDLMQLAKKLVELGDRTLDRLALSEQLRSTIDAARRIENPSARNRALRRVRIDLRGADAAPIRERLQAIQDPSRTWTPSAVDHWQSRMISGGDAEIDEFVRACPDADRQRLRQLVRNAGKATDAERPERLRALSKALREYLHHGGTSRS